MRKKIVAGNWKMNNGLAESQALITEVRGIIRDELRLDNVDVILFPTHFALPSCVRLLEGSGVFSGAQNCHQEKSGAYTGEVSASMIKSVGATHVIIGHSERRQYFGEDNEICNAKVRSAIDEGLMVLYCIGETLEERESNSHFDILKSQLINGLKEINAQQLNNIVIAYEPVWAIGTGKTASSEQAQEIHAFLREQLSAKYGDSIAQSVRILYGGSVKPDNAKDLFLQKDIDGGLIGGASLKARDFAEIVRAAQ